MWCDVNGGVFSIGYCVDECCFVFGLVIEMVK